MLNVKNPKIYHKKTGGFLFLLYVVITIYEACFWRIAYKDEKISILFHSKNFHD